MSTTVTYQGDTIATLENETKTLLTQGKWAENNIIITDSTRGGVETETDPVFSASPAASITQTNINNWNNKSDFSGNYNDLTNKPTIPAAQVSSDWNATSGIAQILHKPVLANVATSGNYEDLTNKPVLDTSLSTVSTRAVENQAISIALEDKASKQYVDTAISNIPSPMIFKGSLGTNGTITSLPNASVINTGFTYKVIQAGIYASQTAEIGDIFISDGTTWILVPSGDDIANVVVTPVQSSGTKIAVVTVNNTSTDLYAPTPVTPPNASTLAPNMDGTAAAGTSTSYARADHIHPVDTSRASANDVSNLTTRVGSLETAIGTGGSVDNKIATAIQGLDSSITATSGEAISAITITDGKITTSSKITIPTYSVATTAANGLMSAADKAKINALSTVDNNTTYALATTTSDGLMSSTDKVKLNNLSTVDNNTTYANATTASDGLMSSIDKLKLDNCSTGSGGTSYQYIADGSFNSVELGSINTNTASGQYSIAEGYNTQAEGQASHAEGYDTKASGNWSHSEGRGTRANGNYSHVEGMQTTSSGLYSHAEGQVTLASESGSHAEGQATTASGYCSHAEGYETTASGEGAHSEGAGTLASTAYSHAEGAGTTASGPWSHAEGNDTIAGSYSSHVEGCNSTASGSYSHAEGYGTLVSAQQAHVEGSFSTAAGKASHAEGNQTLTIGNHSHAEGSHTTASGESSHSGGNYTIATRDSQTIIGKYNKITSNNNSTVSTDAAFVIGNGSSAARSDAFAVKWDGTLVFANGAEITPAQFAQLLTSIGQYEQPIWELEITQDLIQNGTFIEKDNDSDILPNYLGPSILFEEQIFDTSIFQIGKKVKVFIKGQNGLPTNYYTDYLYSMGEIRPQCVHIPIKVPYCDQSDNIIKSKHLRGLFFCPVNNKLQLTFSGCQSISTLKSILASDLYNTKIQIFNNN